MKEVNLRPAEPNDALLLFRWRNDVDTMKNSGNRDQITWYYHKAWLHDVIADPYRTLLIGETNGGSIPVPVGMVRLDDGEDGQTVSITVDPITRRMGFGHAMLTKLMEQHGNKSMVAHVRRENTQSLLLFEKSGFKQVETGDPVWCLLRKEPTHSLSL